MAASNLGPSRKGAPCIQGLAPGSVTTLAKIEGSGIIQHIWMTVTDRTDKDYYVLRDLVLRMYWDDEETPSVETPLGDFFCCGFGRGCTVNSIPIVVNPTRGMNCYFPMPFKKGAKITLENQHEAEVPAFFYQVDYLLTDELPEDIGYFHAQWRREYITEKQKDYTILDQVKGKGHYVGTYMALTALERYWWGEGEVKFYLDNDKEYPTICGTGAEDYFCGSYNFENPKTRQYQEFTTPYAGMHQVIRPDGLYRAVTAFGLYRWHILDPIRFDKDLRVTIQDLGWRHDGRYNNQKSDISSTTFWYQAEPHAKFPRSPLKDDLEIPRWINP